MNLVNFFNKLATTTYPNNAQITYFKEIINFKPVLPI